MTEMKKPVRLGSPEYQAVYDSILNYFNGDQLAADVLIGKYLHRDNEFLYETSPEDLFNRLTDEFYRIEQKYPNPLSRAEIYDLLKDFKKLIMAGSPMAGIGIKDSVVSLSNCYVVPPVEDSYGGIMRNDEWLVQISKRRGGLGFDVSNIRPVGATVKNSAITSSGLASFMQRYSNTVCETGQNGRRAALMLSCSIDSPAIEEFINAKTDGSSISGANISVKLGNEFMHCAEHNEIYLQHNKYDSKIDAAKIFNNIVFNAWKYAEPGILFWDTIMKYSNGKVYGPEYTEVSTNPCFVGDTLLLTTDGYRTFEQLSKEVNFGEKGYHTTFIDKDNVQQCGKVWSNGFKHVIKLVFENKSYIECTPNHIFMLQDGSECQARHLIGQIVKGFDGNDSKCTQIIDDGNIKEVFDFNLQGDNHWGVVGGLIAHNCSELPLPAFASCILLHMNLSSYVKNEWSKSANFDFDTFKLDVSKAARIADDFIDLEIEAVGRIIAKIASDPEPIDIKQTELSLWTQVQKKLVNTRRYGLGFIGLGDTFAKLGITYGTQESIDFGQQVQYCICNCCYSTSVELAKERGAFPIFDLDKDAQSMFIQNVIANVWDTEIIAKYEQWGRRNIACNTVAPTGSTSCLSQTTSGIEPVFIPIYKRRRKLNESEDKSKATFVDANTGERFVEYIVVHQPLLEWMIKCVEFKLDDSDTTVIDFVIHEPKQVEITPYLCERYKYALLTMPETLSKSLFKASPYYKSTTEDIDWIGKVELQGAIQKYVDAAISVTINIPNSATKELVHDIYMTAWKAGCKGCTIYRDGSRSGVLVSVDNNANNAKASSNSYILANGKRSKRKPVLPAQIYTFRIKGEYWCIFIGIDNGKPYEVFAFKPTEDEFNQLQQMVDNDVTTTITKVKKKVYRLGDSCSFIKAYNDIIKRFDMDEQQTITRLYSTMLRNGVNLDEIVDQTEKSTANLSSFCKAIGRALKTFIAEGTSLYEKCPQCGGDLVKFDGCTRCKNCGFSKCG